jgi:hypothetical protein
LTAASGSMPLLLPSPCVTGSALSFSLTGQHVGAASFTLCYGLLLCFPFSGRYNASTQSVTRLCWLPAIRRPDTYRNWTFTSEQMMIYQDTPRFVWRLYVGATFTFLLSFGYFVDYAPLPQVPALPLMVECTSQNVP